MHDLSVIMATYNETPIFLTTCIDSILNQTFRSFGFVIVVEPQEKNMEFLSSIESTDKRVKILKNERRLGVAGSRNKAILETSGKYLAFMDSDDYCAPYRFEKQLSFLENNPDVSVVGSNMYLVDENNNMIGERKYPELHEKIKRSFLFTMAVANPSIMVRRNDMSHVGFFDDKLFKAEDFDLWLRFLVKDKKMHNLQDKLVFYRTHPNDNKKRGRLHYKNYFAAFKKHGKFIWPFHQRFFSLLFFFVVSNIPNYLLDYLLNLKIVKRIKNIRMH
ncbi:MAG: glycosyltransferase [Thermodesulfovibrionales bacterium]